VSVRHAQEVTGFAAADFSRVRRANLGRFTVDRLMTMLNSKGTDRRTPRPGEDHAGHDGPHRSGAEGSTPAPSGVILPPSFKNE